MVKEMKWYKEEDEDEDWMKEDSEEEEEVDEMILDWEGHYMVERVRLGKGI